MIKLVRNLSFVVLVGVFGLVEQTPTQAFSCWCDSWYDCGQWCITFEPSEGAAYCSTYYSGYHQCTNNSGIYDCFCYL